MKNIKYNFNYKKVGLAFFGFLAVAVLIALGKQSTNTNAQMYSAELSKGQNYDQEDQFLKWKNDGQAALNEIDESCVQGDCLEIEGGYLPEMQLMWEKINVAIETKSYDLARDLIVEFSRQYDDYWTTFSNYKEQTLKPAATEANSTYSCTEEDLPVCANGVTYLNYCEAEAKGINNYDDGKCPEASSIDVDLGGCADVYQPICGTDEKTYQNECFAKKAGVFVEYKGECKVNPNSTYRCTEEDLPVCANGVTYLNYCEAEAKGINNYDDGKCKPNLKNSTEAKGDDKFTCPANYPVMCNHGDCAKTEAECGDGSYEKEGEIDAIKKWIQENKETLAPLVEACNKSNCNSTTRSLIEEGDKIYNGIVNAANKEDIETAKQLIETYYEAIESFWEALDLEKKDFYDHDFIDEDEITEEARQVLMEQKNNIEEQSIEIRIRSRQGRSTNKLKELNTIGTECVKRLEANLDNPRAFWENNEKCHEVNITFWEEVSNSYDQEETLESIETEYSRSDEIRFQIAEIKDWIKNINLWMQEVQEDETRKKISQGIKQMKELIKEANKDYQSRNFNKSLKLLKEIENIGKEIENALSYFHDQRNRAHFNNELDFIQKEIEKSAEKIKRAVSRKEMSEEKGETCLNHMAEADELVRKIKEKFNNDKWEDVEKYEAQLEEKKKQVETLCPQVFEDNVNVDNYNEAYIEKKNHKKSKEVIKKIKGDKNKTLKKVRDYSNIINKLIEATDEKTGEKVAKAIEEAANAPEKVREKILALKESVLKEIKELKEAAEALKKAKKIAEEELEELEKIKEEISDHTFASDAGEELKENIEKTIQNISEADASEVKTEVKKLKAKAKEAIKKDIKKKYDDGIIAFLDTDSKEWFAQWAKEAKDAGFVKGDGRSGGKYLKPSSKANIAEVITMFGRIVGEIESNDVNSKLGQSLPNWAKPAAVALEQKGLKLDRLFPGKNASDDVSRAEVAELLTIVFKLDQGPNPNFPDLKSATPEQQDAISAVNAAKIMTGEGDGNFNPNGGLNRAAMVKVLIKAQEYAKASQ